MHTSTYLYLALLFFAVFGAVLLLTRPFAPRALHYRLHAAAGNGADAGGRRRRWLAGLLRMAIPLGKLSAPQDPADGSSLRLRFLHAGLRTAAAPALFYGAKTALSAALPAACFFLGGGAGAGAARLFWPLAAAAAGYYLPNLLLGRLARRRQRDIFDSLPDALDLMTVCVEAGLAMDAALARVAGEIGLKSAVLAEELQLVTLELRAGSGKEKALRNLALRTGVDDVNALVTMLIQAERFGTGIGVALRVQSEQLRTKRRQRAEEQAAKISLKLLFPLIFFIFPALMVVLMGPAVIQIYRQLLPAMLGAG
ncbi:type II secretion system F family protein [Janthinobacterium fluminis]|uniref:Type II secretion system F family protein n=1 Tax=Janthinobacterium fluminis TaxID=2987524 RepID=A0ABT5K2Q4_9BURK|nr:type II secretion system F family protein [Janthinobacterium fluminis]MDC8758022.1 type II secretion system F family protein [Janthinobacterium fluminis]